MDHREDSQSSQSQDREWEGARIGDREDVLSDMMQRSGVGGSRVREVSSQPRSKDSPDRSPARAGQVNR